MRSGGRRASRASGYARSSAFPSAALRVLLGALGLGLFVVVFVAALVGERSVGTNIAPTFIWVIFWVGLVPLTILFGNVWAWLNPWRAAADFVAWCWRRAGLEWEPPFTYPERLGRWPAAFLLFCFAALELAYTDPSDPRMLALAVAIYSWITWVGMAAFGRDVWLRGGEAFAVYFGLISPALDPDAARGTARAARSAPQRRARPRACRERSRSSRSCSGSVAFDGFGRTSYWQDRLFRIDTDLGAIAFNLLGLAVGVASSRRRTSPRSRSRDASAASRRGSSRRSSAA